MAGITEGKEGVSYKWEVYWKLVGLVGVAKMDKEIIYTRTKVCRPFSLLTCEVGHPMFLTYKTLYKVDEDSFVWPGVYFKDNLIDLNQGKDIYSCHKCGKSALAIDKEGIHIFVRSKKTNIWPIAALPKDSFLQRQALAYRTAK